MRNQDRYRSGRFRPNTYVCGYCGRPNVGAIARDICAARHMLRRPRWYKKAVGKHV